MNFLSRFHPAHRLCCEVWVLLFVVLIWTQKSSAERFSASHSMLVAASARSPVPVLHYDGRYAHATPGLPQPVQIAVQAANRLQGKPYVWGGGHRYLFDHGYDCSGTVSYVLHQAGLLPGPRLSQDFLRYGNPGPGRFITIYAKSGHVFMSVCGLRLDTSDYGSGRGDGPRWRPTARNHKGYTLRHPPGL